MWQDAGRAQRDVDMEVVFQPGLEGLGERLLAGKRSKAARSSETVWDAYMRRRKCVQIVSSQYPCSTTLLNRSAGTMAGILGHAARLTSERVMSCK